MKLIKFIIYNLNNNIKLPPMIHYWNFNPIPLESATESLRNNIYQSIFWPRDK